MDESSLEKTKSFLLQAIISIGAMLIILILTSLFYTPQNKDVSGASGNSLENNIVNQNTETDYTETTQDIPQPSSGERNRRPSSSGGGGGGGGGSSSSSTPEVTGNTVPDPCTLTNNGIEICDSIDNDCDGIADQNGLCTDNFFISNGQTLTSFKKTGSKVSLDSVGPVSQSIEFYDSDIWEISLINNLQEESVIYPESFANFQVEIQDDILTMTWSNNPLISGVNVISKVDLLNEMAEFSIEIQNNNPEYAIESINYPVIHTKPIGGPNDFLSAPYGEGYLIHNANTLPAGTQTTYHPGWTQNMQYFAMYDPLTLKQFYFQTTDSLGHRKDFILKSDGSSNSFTVTHYPENNIVPGNDYISPFKARIVSRQGDWYDAAKYYKEWAINQPWTSNGKIIDSTYFSQKLKNSKLFVYLIPYDPTALYFNNFDLLLDELNRINSLLQLNNGNIISLWYGWHNNAFDSDLPDFLPPQSTVLPSISSARSQGYLIVPYTHIGLWKKDSTSYIENNVEQYITHDKSGSISEGQLGPQAQPHTFLDWGISGARNVGLEVITEITNSLSVDGIYIDLYSGLPPTLSYTQTTEHPLGGGSYWTQGKILVTQAIQSMLKLNNADRFLISESFDESLIGEMEMVNSDPYIPGTNNIIFAMPFWSTVYHEYQFTTNFGPIVPPITIENIELQKYAIAISFSFGKLLSVSNTLMSDPIRLIGDATSSNPTQPQQEFFSFVKKLADTDEARKYQRFGERLRPLPGSLEDVWTQYGISQGVLIPSNSIVPAEIRTVWLANHADIGIILTNYKNMPEQFTIDLQFDKYSLSGEYQLYKNNAGIRTLINPSVNSDMILQVTVEPNDLNLYELVKVQQPSLSPEQTQEYNPSLRTLIILLSILLIILIISLIAINKRNANNLKYN